MANVGPFSIVLLFENQANSLQIVQSLREKGLDVQTVNSASELIQMIAGHKFDLVALSVNHSSSTSLVQVLKIKTKVEVLVFGEDASPTTSKAILKAGADYQVAGAISSYNLWLKIGHLVKEKQRHNETASRMLSGRIRADDDSSAMLIKSSAKSKAQGEDDEKVSVVKSTIKTKKSVAVTGDVSVAPEQSQKVSAPKKEKKLLMGAKKKKNKIIHAADVEETTVSKVEIVDNESEVSSKVHVQEQLNDVVAAVAAIHEKMPPKGKLMKVGKAAAKIKQTAPNVEAAAIKTPELKLVSSLTEEQLIDKEIDQIQNMFFDEDQNKETLKGRVDLQEKADRDAGKVKIAEPKERPSKITIKGDKSQNQVSSFSQEEAQAKPTEKKSHEEESSYETEEDKIVSIEAARAHRKKQRDKRREEQKQKKNASPQSATVHSLDKLRFKKQFREAVAKAGEKGFQKSENTRTIGVVTRVSLIPVDNMSEKGFIIMANNMNDYSTVDEVSEFKTTLVKELKGLENQEFILGDTYNIETFEVDVAAWAERSSQFFYTYESPDTGKQMLICFLRKENVFPNARKMEEHNMHRIELGDLPPRAPVSFDAYLFLARNEKMLPYLRRGGWITSKQVQRLYQRGFKFLYIRDEEIRDYYSFYFSLYLNQDFRSERKLA